jgi:hypothetical protein
VRVRLSDADGTVEVATDTIKYILMLEPGNRPIADRSSRR